MKYHNLKRLRRDHSARNTPLCDIGAECKTPAEPEWNIPEKWNKAPDCKFTYNELTPHHLREWRSPVAQEAKA